LATLTYFEAVLLGLVQGLAEFLPVSSSGHLALIQHFFGISGDSVLLFTVMLHLGTLISVFIIYWKDIARLLYELGRCIGDICRGRGPRININETRRLGFMIIVATIPTAIIGLLFNKTFEAFYTNMLVVGIGLLITGTILYIAEKFGRSEKQIKDMKFRDAVIVGIMQGIAITPGISRSGSCLFGGLMTNLDRKLAVRFAFLISIPSILGSFIFELKDAAGSVIPAGAGGPVAVGMIVSLLSGLFAIKAMITIVTRKSLKGFSYYTWVLGAFVVVYALFLA